MACPRCGSNNLWDDNLWWGCDDCGYAGGPDGGTMMFAKDKPGLARTVAEVNQRAGRGVVPNHHYNHEEDDE